MPTLVLLQGGKVIPHEIIKDRITLGRHPDCDIQLDSNMVSRHHARIIKQNGQYVLEDLGSGNGSYINGKKIEEPSVLKHEDRLKIGPLLFRFELREAPSLVNTMADTEPEAQIPAGLLLAGDEEEGHTTIMSAVDTVGGFGMLDVQPEAKLKGVLEISRSLAGTVELKVLLPKILDTLFTIFPYADRGTVLLKNAQGLMVPQAQKHRRTSDDSSVKLSRTILNKVLQDRTGILSADAASDQRFQASESISSLTIRSMMCVPMLNRSGDVMGIINLDTQNALNQFKKDDLDLLMAVAGQAALTYESAQLMAAYMDKQRQDNEMRIAKSVQQALLPEGLPQVEGYEFYASYDSAQAVGGDYYDWFIREDGKVVLSFGDVAGKGVPGALIMSRMATVVQSIIQYEMDAGAAVQAINNNMCKRAVDGRFVTYVLVIVDPVTHEMTLVNAGHMSPLIRKPDGRVEEFSDETIGIPIGIMEDYPYDVVQRTLQPGETVVIITDGVDEAMNPAGELYTKERVKQFVSKNSPKADVLGQALLADVRRHANGRPQNDDITIMTFGRN